MASIQRFLQPLSNVLTGYMLIEGVCLQVNWGAKFLFVASFIIFAKAVCKWLANAIPPQKVMSHCSTLLHVYSGLVHTCLLLDY